jgi:hypothetical protein
MIRTKSNQFVQLRCWVVCLLIGVGVFSTTASLGQSADSALRTAYLEVYTQVTVAMVAKRIASECNPTSSLAYGRALDAWERQHKVGSAFRLYASQVLTANELKATQLQERDEIVPKVRKAFATCPSPQRFTQMLAARDFDLTTSKPSSLVKVHEAMEKAGVVVASTASVLPAVAAHLDNARIDSVLAMQSTQIGANGTMVSEVDFVAVFSDGWITSDLNRVFASGPRKPNQAGRFIREADNLKVTWDSGVAETLRPSSMIRLLPAPPSFTLNGQFRVFEPNGNVSANLGIEFFADGRYNSGTPTSPKRVSGTYQVNGHSIEFKPANAAVEKQLFFVVPTAHRGQLGQIGVGNLRLVQRD